MYCSKCGEADQNVNSYCRKCGNFLLENLVKQLNLGTAISVFTFTIISVVLLLWIMTKIYEALEGRSIFNLEYSTYLFLGTLAFLQLTQIIKSVRLMRKINKVAGNSDLPSEEMQKELTSPETRDFLPPADFQSVIPSVVEVTTKNLDKVRRK